MSSPSLPTPIALLLSASLALGACGGNSDAPVVAEAEPEALIPGQDAGLIASALPLFQWPAEPNVERYRLRVEDEAGNGYSKLVEATTNCDAGTCRATPAMAYNGKELSWRVEPADAPAALANNGRFTTPVSLDLAPITSNPDACDAPWPSVAYDKFIVLNNIWNHRSMQRSDWSQTVNVAETAGGAFSASWTYDWLESADGGIFDVKAYPEVIYGNKLGTHVSAPSSETGLPAAVSNMPRFDVSFAYSETGNAERNVAIESFFHDSCEITGPCDLVDNRAYEMMVWVANPSLRTPGSTRAETGVEIDGRLWDVWIKPAQNTRYIAFTAQEKVDAGSLHWNSFVEWTVQWTADNETVWNIDPLLQQYCMGAIEIGTELWWGQGGFSLDAYDVTVQ